MGTKQELTWRWRSSASADNPTTSPVEPKHHPSKNEQSLLRMPPFTRRQVLQYHHGTRTTKGAHDESKGATKAKQLAEYEAWYEEQGRLGLEDLDAGRVVSDEDVRKHFEKRFKQHAGRQQKQAA